MSRLLAMPDLVATLKLGPTSIKKLIAEGKLRRVPVSAKILVAEEELERFIREATDGAASPPRPSLATVGVNPRIV